MEPTTTLDASELVKLGTSSAAIVAHYDLNNDFFALFLDESLGYSSGMWHHSASTHTIEAAQDQKIDWFAGHLGPSRRTRLLDIGCGWGGPLTRFVTEHHVGQAVGLTLSPAQAGYVLARGLPDVEVRIEGWQEHEPALPYDVIVSFEALEHFARDGLSSGDKIVVYSNFFERCARWLIDGGLIGLQTCCFENTGELGTRPGRGPLADFIRERIFPEATPAHLSEIVTAWEPFFELVLLESDPRDHAKTYRSWLLKLRANRDSATALVGHDTYRMFMRYLAGCEAMFRTEEWSVYRFLLRKRRRFKT